MIPASCSAPPTFRWESNPRLILFGVVAVLAVLRLWVAEAALLSGDEAYYWLWTKRLQLSYYDHPGMAAWWSAFSTSVLGDSEGAFRLPSVLSGVLVTLVMADLAARLFRDAWAGVWTALWLNATVLFTASAVTATPDGPLLVFWSLALWCVVRLFDEGRVRWLYGLGAALGLGFSSKYTMVLIAPGILAAFLLFPDGRRWWRSPHFYLAVVVAVVGTSPVLVWNLLNDWVSIRKQLAHSFETPVSNPWASLGTLAATQIGVMTPVILVSCLWGMVVSLWRGWKNRQPALFVLGACSAPILLFFIKHSLGGLVQPHWPGPAYLGAVAAASGFLLRDGRTGVLRIGAGLGAIMAALACIQMGTAVIPIPPKLDPLSRLGGWDGLAREVQTQKDAHPEAFVFVQKHELSGLLTYYLPGHPPIFLTGSTGIPRIPSYDAAELRPLRGRTGLFVTKSSPEGVEDARRYFERLEKVAEYKREWGGVVIDRYEIWLGASYRPGQFNENGDYIPEPAP